MTNHNEFNIEKYLDQISRKTKKMIKTKTITTRRRFEFKNMIPYPYGSKWVFEVIEGMEKDELLVFDPNDENGMVEKHNEKGEWIIDEKAKLPINIKEWLGVGCQRIREYEFDWDGEPKDESPLACYSSNAEKVLWPRCEKVEPIGPAALSCEIVIFGEIAQEAFRGEGEDKFKGVIAHELTHAFDNMRYIVPAFMDWENFWKKLLGEGRYRESVAENERCMGLFLDGHIKKNELLRLKEYWPSQAEKWHKALNLL